MKRTYLTLCVGAVFSLVALAAVDATSCTRIFWNTNPDLMIVGRNEDYVTASHPSLVATPRGVRRWGTADEARRSKTISWAVKYGNVAIYENNRFPNDGVNEAGLTARTTSLRKRRPHGKPPCAGTMSMQSGGSPRYERSERADPRRVLQERASSAIDRHPLDPGAG